VNVYMTNLGPTSIGFAVERMFYSDVQDMLDALVLPMPGDSRVVYLVQSSNEPSRALETQRKLLEPLGEVRELKFEVNEGCTMVSLVAYDYLQQPGVFYRVISLLDRAGIPVLQTNDSDYSLSCLIPESELRRAVSVLHEEFGLANLS
jgi:aspartate kinase